MMDSMIAKVLVNEAEIDEITSRIAAKIDEDYGGRRDKRLVLLGILKGSVVFLGDLISAIGAALILLKKSAGEKGK